MIDESARRRLQAVMRPQDMAAFAEIERAGREQDVVRARLGDDLFVSHTDYGRLVEEAADADERRAWDAEKGDDE